MSQTARFRNLERRLKQLRKNLLPAQFSPTGNYTDRVQDHARGYRLLAHAEIEVYLEDMARDIIAGHVSKWKTASCASHTLLSFIACYHLGWIEYDAETEQHLIDLARNRWKPKETVSEIIDLAQTQFGKKLSENHGVREKNLKTLMLPTGVDLTALDPTWITHLDDFGKKRGDVAHQSPRPTDTIDPQEELKRVDILMVGMKDLDEKLGEVAV
jgi:hypothetical protein